MCLIADKRASNIQTGGTETHSSSAWLEVNILVMLVMVVVVYELGEPTQGLWITREILKFQRCDVYPPHWHVAQYIARR